jgi:hypothetical protein
MPFLGRGGTRMELSFDPEAARSLLVSCSRRFGTRVRGRRKSMSADPRESSVADPKHCLSLRARPHRPPNRLNGDLRHKRGVEGLQKPELRATAGKEDARFASWQGIVADFAAKKQNVQNDPERLVLQTAKDLFIQRAGRWPARWHPSDGSRRVAPPPVRP